MKIFYIILFFLLYSCTSNIDKKKNVSEARHPIYGYIVPDSVSESLWYATLFLVSKSEIPLKEDISNEIIILNDRIHFFKDSILKITNNIPETNDSISILLKKALNGDMNSYCLLTEKFFQFNFNLSPYSLYIAENYDFSPAYRDVYYYYSRLNYSRFKQKYNNPSIDDLRAVWGGKYNLDYLNKREQDLALYSLFKAYMNGDILSSEQLAYYYKMGIYSFPKNIKIANQLNSIYNVSRF